MTEEILKLAKFKLEWSVTNQDPRLLIALTADEAKAVINHIDTLEATLKAYENNAWTGEIE